MKCDGTVNDWIMAGFVHVGVHICICQTENHGLIADQGLIVALHVGNSTFARTAQTHLAPHAGDIPVLVFFLFDCLDPHIRHSHGQTVVKADTAVFNWQAHTRHTGHILRNGDCLRIYLVNQLVGKLKISNCLSMSVEREVLAVIVKIGTKAVIVVQHGSNAVKTEAVKMVFCHPEF